MPHQLVPACHMRLDTGTKRRSDCLVPDCNGRAIQLIDHSQLRNLSNVAQQRQLQLLMN